MIMKKKMMKTIQYKRKETIKWIYSTHTGTILYQPSDKQRLVPTVNHHENHEIKITITTEIRSENRNLFIYKIIL